MITTNSDTIIQHTERWLNTVVIGLNLCPFAKRELTHSRIRFTVTKHANLITLLEALEAELVFLQNNPDTATTLLIHPNALRDFIEYNDFLTIVDDLLEQLNLHGIFQIASFHPDYQFAGTGINDAENYTNRSPYPMLHILREPDVEQAIAHYPDADSIPDKNIKHLQTLGRDKMQRLLQDCTQ